MTTPTHLLIGISSSRAVWCMGFVLAQCWAQSGHSGSWVEVEGKEELYAGGRRLQQKEPQHIVAVPANFQFEGTAVAESLLEIVRVDYQRC